MAEYKNKLFNEYINKPFTIGENIKVRKGLFLSHTNNPKQYVSATIIDEVGDGLYKVKLNKSDGYGYGKDVIIKILEKQYIHKDLSRVGSNPFQNIDFWRRLERVNYDMSSILNCLGLHPTFEKEEWKIDGFVVPEYTDNPYIYDKDGNKQYYQRDYVWTIEDEQLFIESIYNNLDCGKIVIRKRSWDYVESNVKGGNTDSLAFNDIVDGKQRINTLKRFINDEFCDLHGHYYSDLSAEAQHLFLNSHCLTFLSLGENATDEDAINTFLMINFTGKPMSREHLDYVKSIKI